MKNLESFGENMRETIHFKLEKPAGSISNCCHQIEIKKIVHLGVVCEI